MPNIFFGYKDKEKFIFDEHETKHFKTIRVKEGKIIKCTDGKGNEYTVKIEKIEKKKSFGIILESKHIEKLQEKNLILFAPSGKWERLRWLIEKSVELGVDKIYITKTKYSNRNYTEKPEKIELVIRNSAKQCTRVYFPDFRFITFDEIPKYATQKTFFLDLSGEKIPEKFDSSISFIVGPEGGFSPREKEFLTKNFTSVSLGKKILRFETAAFVFLSFVAIKLNKI
ncbi:MULTISPECIES: 16S rRNA (uracil(1498)-N(3))-methyltransferase [unclassified Thermosipho (in: thermotogales)]|uniref:16S rRNA (uracil(1498)-N(3))-methyltransferase n=1 Tax=unclassified Thermosipho (in: thermotogales) TaxID=2676525 RepID=UPI0009841E68|nr:MULTISPECIES: 16S rRNA (uracil(1498)-N(3))-methyltransferase [unclassified Thermosipho (in: thermotogales)]MBT1248503.1 16S rRNA methyltransferase [Thermosipho sp. 1244]OOC47274.1 16S rRNA methyltransferase [Thermosipho sp. 1223]